MSAAGQPPEGAGPDRVPDRAREYWRRSLGFSAALLVIWFVVTFVVAFFARELSVSLFGWPLSFWIGAQGSILVYLAIVAAYARYMSRLDREFGLDEDG